MQSFRKDWEFRRGRVQLVILTLVVILILTVYFSMNVRLTYLGIVVAGVASMIAFVLLSRWMELGFIGLIMLSYMGAYAIKTGTNVDLNLTLIGVAALIGVWLLKMIVIDRRVRLQPTRINIPAILFILAVTISLIAGNLHWILQAAAGASFNAQIGGWSLYVLSIGLMLLTANQVRNTRWLSIIVWVFLGVGFIYIIGRFITPIGKFTDKIYLVGASSMFYTWLAALSYGQFISNNQLRWPYRLLLGVIAASTAILGWFVAREWVSGWLPVFLAIFVITWLHNWRWGLALTAAAGAYIFLNITFLNSSVMTSSQQYSVDSRMGTLPVMMELIKASPIIGLGPANYYHYTYLFPILGWYVNFNSHNNYIDIVAQTGLLGMALFVWLMAELGFLGLRLRSKMKDGFSRGYLVAVMGGMVGMLASGMMGDWFLPFLYNVGVKGFRGSSFAWLFIGGMLVLERLSRTAPAGDQPGE